MSRGQGRLYRQPGSAVWWLDYSVGGRRHRESSSTTRRGDAADMLRERIGHRKDGRLVGRPERVVFAEYGTDQNAQRKLVGGLRAGLERHYQREGNRSLRRAQQALDHLERFLGAEARALDITKQRVGEYLDHRLREGAARATVRYEIAVLNAAFSVAVNEDETLAVRPIFKLPTVENARSGFFEDGEFAALLLELPADVRPVVRFLRLTGWRKSEALGLTWDSVDWESHVLRLRAGETKGGEARVFPFGLAPDLKALLDERWRARDGVFVFHRDGARIRNIRSQWAAACVRAGLGTRDPKTKRVTLQRIVHDLRRTAARDYRRAGLSEGEIMKLCGWETRDMFDRYNIIDEQDLAAAVAKRFAPSPSSAPAPTA